MMAKRYGYIYSIPNNINWEKQKFSLITSGINSSNIFIEQGKDNIENNHDTSQESAWNKLSRTIGAGDQLFINNLNDLITKNDVYNIDDSFDEISTIRNRIFPLVQRKIEVISLGDKIKINDNNIKKIFHIMNAALNMHNNYLFNKPALLDSQSMSGPNSSRASQDKSILHRHIYSYIKQGNQKTKAAQKFGVSYSTIYRIIHRFDKMQRH